MCCAIQGGEANSLCNDTIIYRVWIEPRLPYVITELIAHCLSFEAGQEAGAAFKAQGGIKRYGAAVHTIALVLTPFHTKDIRFICWWWRERWVHFFTWWVGKQKASVLNDCFAILMKQFNLGFIHSWSLVSGHEQGPQGFNRGPGTLPCGTPPPDDSRSWGWNDDEA